MDVEALVNDAVKGLTVTVWDEYMNIMRDSFRAHHDSGAICDDERVHGLPILGLLCSHNVVERYGGFMDLSTAIALTDEHFIRLYYANPNELASFRMAYGYGEQS